MSTSAKERFEKCLSLVGLGFSYEQARQLRRISMTLQRWFELECGTENTACSSISVERDEETDKPYMRLAYMSPKGKYIENKWLCADKEKGARARLSKLMAGFPDLTYYIQTDPRGCSLYVLKKSDVNGHDIEKVYNRGVAVY